MNRYLLLMALFCGSVYAEPESLPPVIDNSSYAGGVGAPRAAGNNANSNSATAMYQVLGQMEQLQKEVRQLSGTIEEQAHELAELKKSQKARNEDMDQRLQSLENAQKTAETAVPVAPVTELAPAAVPAIAAPPVAEAPAAVVPVPAIVPPTTAVAPVAPSSPSTANAVPKPILPVVKSGAEKADYQKAYEHLKTGQYSTAIASFNAFLANYPQSDYAANAQYWIGEAQKANHNIEAAREAFNQVVNTYPNSPKAPDALLKLGYLELEQGNSAKAREYLSRVASSFPNTPAAQLAAKKIGMLNGVH